MTRKYHEHIVLYTVQIVYPNLPNVQIYSPNYIFPIYSFTIYLSLSGYAKLKETNERNRFDSMSMDEVFLRNKPIFAKLSSSYLNSVRITLLIRKILIF